MKLKLKLTDEDNKRWVLCVYILLSLIPMLAGIFCIQFYGVNVPYADQWRHAGTLINGKASWPSGQEIFSLHHEHRTAATKIISLMLVRLFSTWNIKLEMMVGYAFSGLAYGLLVVSILRQCGLFKMTSASVKSLHLGGLSILASSLLLFSPVQYENWLWSFQIPWFLVIFCLIAAVFLLDICFEKESCVAFLLAIICCVVASFSLAHGLFIWFACLPMFLKQGLKRRTSVGLFAIWLGSATITAIVYLADYRQPRGHPDPYLIFEKPSLAIDFFLNLTGAAFGRAEIPSLVIGLLLIGAYVIAIFYCLKSPRRIQNQCLPWISIGLYSIIFALITTAGRLGLSSEAAFAPRYTTVSLLLPICLINFSRIFLVFQQNRQEYRLYTAGLLFLSGVLFSSLIAGYTQGFASAKTFSSQRHLGKTCLELYDYIETQLASDCITNYVYPNLDEALTITNQLRQQQLLKEFPTWNFDERQDFDQDQGQISNSEVLRTPNGDVLKISGWAFSEGHPGMVLLGREAAPALFTVTEVGKRRRDIAEEFSSDQYLHSGWEVHVALNELPNSVGFLTVYLYDLEEQKLYKLGQLSLADLRTKAGS